MKPGIGAPDDDAYRFMPDSHAIIHNISRQATGAGPVFGRVPGVDG